ncbi:tRNA (guanine-N(1)-)-methyltransferase TRM10 [Strigomonas culicis]|uniref:tRNA (guanine(9)-N(1))-methyltransferase n=1 Tax=Strigomonas culicis TaxID=28005 RepID=S9V838_9TRYP|nr:tRNA (guanine-N(1)-)-methyltransferase TRM10 [Strigomonas culicis]|eukprot:EPY36998.1 tRNA (guanine-N(1)-)-methyltransferase TRM10 [Strigomonas culicis]
MESEPPQRSQEHTAHASPATAHVTPAAHRRNRKSWTEEEKRAFWQARKQEKKERRRVKIQQKKEEERSAWEHLTEEEQDERRQAAMQRYDQKREAEARRKEQCLAHLQDPATPVLVYDLSFSWCMTAADTKSTVKQVQYAYSALRRETFPFRPVLCSVGGTEAADERDCAAQREVLRALVTHSGFLAYGPLITEQHWSELFPKEKIVFLSADSEEVLREIEPTTVYVVGAFVDHNKHKGLSYERARQHGVRTARLPLKESVDIGNRCKVLTINHLTEVLVRYMREGGGWAGAIEAALPVRRAHQETLGSLQKRRRGQDSPGGSEADTSESSNDAN